jgi:hypothetical protein
MVRDSRLCDVIEYDRRSSGRATVAKVLDRHLTVGSDR